jgi:phage tail tape-measure protein
MATSTPWWASAPAVTESMGRPSGVVEAGDAAGVTASSTSGAGRVRGRVEVVVVVMASCFWFGWW